MSSSTENALEELFDERPSTRIKVKDGKFYSEINEILTFGSYEMIMFDVKINSFKGMGITT